MSHFLGEEGWGESVKKENESPHGIFINLTRGLWAQKEVGNCGNPNYITRTVYYHEITNLLRQQYNLHISSPISNCLTLICCCRGAHSRRGSERQANQSKAFRESQWAYFCLTELHKGSLQRGKKPRLWCKKRFLKQKTLFGRDNIKIGTISAFFLLLRLQWGNLRSWKNALKMQSADRCEGSRQILEAVSFIRAGRLEDSPACWIILDLHSLWSNPLQEWSPHVSLSLCLLFFLLTPPDS